jgi:hypothetical protein
MRGFVHLDPRIVFVVMSGLSYAVLVLLVRWFIAPYLATQPVRKIMLLLLTPHICHHAGLAVLVPGVVGIGFPQDWAWIIAVGEIVMLSLVMLCMGALRNGSVRAPLFLWVFTVTGFVYNFIADWVAILESAALADNFHAAWYVAVFYVPLLLVSHVLVLINLLRRGHELRDLKDQRLPRTPVAF